MRAAKLPGLAAMLGAMLLILAACGTGADETADNNTDTLAVVTPTTVSTDASSPMPEATAVISAEGADQPPATTMVEQDDQSATVEAASDDVPATKEAESEEQPTDPQVTLIAETSDDAFGKDIPSGPAPTAPPAPPSDFDSDGDGRYTIDEFEEAIRYRYPEYEWPPNYQLDLDKAIEGMSFPEGSQHEAPGEYTFLGLYHECAWQLTLIDASLESDQELINESLYQLVDFGQAKNPLDNDENGKAFIRDMYDRAALGDIAPFQQWVDNNCDLRRQYFITPDHGTPSASFVTVPEQPSHTHNLRFLSSA